MKFLVLLLTLGAYKYFGFRVSRAADQWFCQWQEWLHQQLSPGYLSALLILGLPILLAALVLNAFGGWFMGLLGVLLQVLLLFYALGRGNLLKETKDYLSELRQGNTQAAYHKAADYFSTGESADIQNQAELHREVRAGVLYQWFEQIFLVVFWFLLAGPLAALFIRLLCLQTQALKSQADKLVNEGEGAVTASQPIDKVLDLIKQLMHWLEWLPCRLVGITFALAGNFTLCFKSWTRSVTSLHDSTVDVLHRSGLAAIGICSIDPDDPEVVNITPDPSDLTACADEIQTITDLMVRSLICWVMVVALVMLFV